MGSKERSLRSAILNARPGSFQRESAVWPKVDIRIGADTLWLDAKAQSSLDENTRIFAEWRARHGLSLAAAAQALGLTTRTISTYGTGARPVPRYIALACKGWEAERQNTAHRWVASRSFPVSAWIAC